MRRGNSLFGEFLAKNRCNAYLGMGSFCKSESPDLQNLNDKIGIDVTYGTGEKYLISLRSKNIKNLSWTKDDEREEVLNAFKHKLPMRYGFKTTGLYIYSLFGFDNEDKNLEFLKTVKKANNGVYDFVVFDCLKNAKLMLFDLKKEKIKTIKIDENKFVSESALEAKEYIDLNRKD